jgi:hypothetical protein
MIAHLFDGARAINGANDGNVALSQQDIDQLRKLFNDMLFRRAGPNAGSRSESR